MIPKIIHYCWFGNGEKPELVLHCIESWKMQHPDWEIIEWNESNFDVNKMAYMKEAYEKKKWAFVSDVARLLIIYNNGGIYLDTDVELLQPINEDILNYDSVFAFEMEARINSGMGFASKADNPVLKYLIDDYESRSFIKPDGTMNLEACTYYNTTKLEKIFKDLRLDDSFQIIENNAFITTGMYNKYAIHHYASSWTNTPKTTITQKKVWKDTKLKRFLRNHKRQKWIKQHFGYKGQKCYEFIAYDLLEAGPVYFIKRVIKRFID